MLPLPKGAVWQLLFLLCAGLYITGVRSEGRVVCYYTNWSVYRPGTAKFNPQNINPYLCTHLIYAFGGFTKDNQMKPFDKYQDIEQGGYAKFTGLKTYNKQLKTMIAIGGWNEASSRFSPLVANAERRQKFIKNILKFLRQNHFDGIDLDWEYPAHREGGKPRDRDNYAQFVQELRAEFERESEKTGRPRLLVTMAVPAGIEYIEKGYDIPKLNKYLDWFNLLTYDFHSSHEPSVNHHAPLYSLEEESEYNYDSELNIDYSIKFYLNAGADRDKLVLGIPTYGRSYTLINEDSNEIGAPAEAPGDQGDATREKGYLAYYEICQNIKEDPEWTVVQPNPNAMGPYAYRRNQWVGYDDEAIVRKKAQYVVDNGLGGIMFWAIDNDDFRGICTGKAYPLIEAAKDAMLDGLGLGINEVSKPTAPQKPSRSRSRENSSSARNRITTTEHKLTYAERKGSSKRLQTTQQTTRNRQQSTTTAAPTSIKLTEAEGSSLYVGGRTTTPPPPTTPDPGTDFKCEDEGFFQHPRDCKKYYWCLDSGPSGLGIVAHQFTCPSGLYFNPAADSCDFARNVPCKIKKSTTAAPITSPATTTTTARPTSSYGRITAATARSTTFFRTTPRTTTTTEAAEEDSEYDEEEDENPSSVFAKPKGFDKDSEEDPKVIKELIELIRKVGGIDELEKHLLRKDDGTISIKENSSSSSSSLTPTTPSSISKSLYEKVLSKPNALSSFRNRFTSSSSFRTTKTPTKTQENTEEDDEESHEIDSKSSGASAGFSKYSSVLRGNSRQGPQSEGLDKLSEFDGFLKEKKQYITINRNRDNKQSHADEEEGEEEDEISFKSNLKNNRNDDEEVEVNSKSTRKSLSASTPSYSTIRRTRPSTTTEANPEEANEEEDEEEQVKGVAQRKSYTFTRNRGVTTTELPEVTEATVGSTRYRYLERSRPTRPTTESSHKAFDNQDNDDDNESENQENTVLFKAVNIENTRETQKEITTNTQRTYASIGRRTTASTTATPETETSSSAAKITTTIAIPTTSTKETPLTTSLTAIETTTPESILTSHIPITTTTPTNPTTTASSTTKTTTTTSPHGEDNLKSFATTPNPNDINSDISETIESTQHIHSLLIDSSYSKSTPSTTTESSLDRNDSPLTTTETTLSSTTATITDSDNLTRTDDTEEEEVNLVSKQRNKTLYHTRTRTTTTTTTTSPKTRTTTTTNVEIETTPSPTITTNAKKPLGVRRQQILLNRSSQTKITSAVTTTDIPITPTTETVNNDFLGTVSSPRPFGFPKRRNRPIGTASSIATTSVTTEEISKPNDDLSNTRQKTTKLNAAANSQTKVSSHKTILSQTATETSSQPEHAQQTESEVTSKEHLNSKDTKVEEHVVEQVVDGIDFINDNLRHDIDNLDSNYNSAHKTNTHTIAHKAGNNADDLDREVYSWHDARRTTTDTVGANEVTNEQTVRQKISPDNAVEVNEKDLRFSKKQDDFVENSGGKYRGKSLEISLENSTLQQNPIESQGEAGDFKTYTIINRKDGNSNQSVETEQTSSFTEKQTDQESEEESVKSKYNYSEISRGLTTLAKTEIIARNTSQESVYDSSSAKYNYTNISRGSSSNNATSSQNNIDEGEINEDLIAKTTRGQDVQINSELVDKKAIADKTAEVKKAPQNETELKSKLKYSSINRNRATTSQPQTETDELQNSAADEIRNQTKTTINYTQITEGTRTIGEDHDTTNSEAIDGEAFKSNTETEGSHVNDKFKYSTLDRSSTAATDSQSREDTSQLTRNSEAVDDTTPSYNIEDKIQKSQDSQAEGERTTDTESIKDTTVTSTIATETSREGKAEVENKFKYTSSTANYSESRKAKWQGAANSSGLIANTSETNNFENKSSQESDDRIDNTSLRRDSTTSIYSQSTEDVLENIKITEHQNRTTVNYVGTRNTQREDNSESIEDKTTKSIIETETSHENEADLKNKYKYSAANRSSTTSSESPSPVADKTVKSTQDNAAKLGNKFNYISLDRSSTVSNYSQSTKHQLQNDKTNENRGDTIVKYTKTSKAQGSQTITGDGGSTNSESIDDEIISSTMATKSTHENNTDLENTFNAHATANVSQSGEDKLEENTISKSITSSVESNSSSESKSEFKSQFNELKHDSTTASNTEAGSHERTINSDAVDATTSVIEAKRSHENEAELKNEFKYTSVNRNSAAASNLQSQEHELQTHKTRENQSKITLAYQKTTRDPVSETIAYDKQTNNSQSVEDKATQHKYKAHNGQEGNGTKINASIFQAQEISRGQRKHKEDDENSHNKSKTYATFSRHRTSQNEQETENQTENGSHYTTTTKSETDKKTYASIARNRGSGSTTENIPYKAIVRDREGVHLNEEQFSGFIKQTANSDAEETSKKTYQNISRGGQILQNGSDIERNADHLHSDLIKIINETEKQFNKDEDTTRIRNEGSLTTETKPITITAKSDIRTSNAEATTTIPLSTAESTKTSENTPLILSNEGTIETTTTTPTPTATKSLFKNRHTTEAISGESETEIRNQTEAEIRININENQEFDQTQTTNLTGRRRVIMKQRPISVTALNKKTNKNKEENTHSLEVIKDSLRTSSPTINKSSLTKVEEERLKVNDNHKQEGRYSSSGRRRGQVEKSNSIDQNEAYSNNETEISNSLSNGQISNSETVNDVSVPSSTKKTLFSSNNSQYASANNSGTTKTFKLNTGSVDDESVEKSFNGEFPRKQVSGARPVLQTSTEAERENEHSNNNNQITSSVTKTLNGRRRTIIRKRIQNGNEKSLRSQSTASSGNQEGNSEKLVKQNNAQSTFTANARKELNRKNAFANRRVANKSVKQQEIENIKTTAEDENSLHNSLKIRNKENPPKTASFGSRRSFNTRLKNKNDKTEEVEILEDGSKRIKTTYTETINIGGNKVKTIKKTKIKTIIKQAPEYEDDGDDAAPTPTTRRPTNSNRGPARFESDDLSSLLALDFASKSHRYAKSERNALKSRRKVIRRPPIIKEEEYVEEFEEELPATAEDLGSTTATPQIVNSRIRPTKPLRAIFTTTTKAPKFDGEQTHDVEEGREKLVNSTRKQPHSAAAGTTLAASGIKDTKEKVEATTRRSFALKRNYDAVKSVATTETTAQDETTTKVAFDFKRPLGARPANTQTTTERIPDTTLMQTLIGSEKNNDSTTTINEEIGESAIASSTVPTKSPETTTDENLRATTLTERNSDSHDSLDLIKNRLANAVRNLKATTEKLAKAEVVDAIEMKNEITTALSNGQDLSVPIYHRRKYYQYYKDSPITYISPAAVTDQTSAEANVVTNADIKKQIHQVFNVSNEHVKPEPELSDEAVAAMALEQAQEINAELSHFLLKTPGSK